VLSLVRDAAFAVLAVEHSCATTLAETEVRTVYRRCSGRLAALVLVPVEPTPRYQGDRLMPLFALDPTPAGLDALDWKASSCKGLCFVSAPDVSTARTLGAAEFVIATRSSPAEPVRSPR
jgi:hypothetical protein